MSQRRTRAALNPKAALLCRLAQAFALALLIGLASAAQAQNATTAKLLPGAAPADCAACHGAQSPVPASHPPTANMQMSQCLGCHAKGSATSLVGKLPLFHTHQLSGVTCATCHGDPAKAEPVAAAKCMTCHAVDKVLAASAQVKPTNPHDSPHYGKENDCNLCHHQHEASENFCAQCHKFDFKVP